jgi:hypothetical protein
VFPYLKAWKATDDGFQIEASKPSEATHKFVAGKDVAEAVLHILAAYFQMLESIDKGNLPKIALSIKAHSIPPYTLLTPPRENLSRGTPVDLDAKITNRLIILRNAYRKVFVTSFSSFSSFFFFSFVFPSLTIFLRMISFSCEQAKVRPLDAMIWQIDRALDEEIALDKLVRISLLSLSSWFTFTHILSFLFFSSLLGSLFPWYWSC